MTSGSWERSRYDTANYDDVLKTNNRRINLIMENPGICDPCRVPEPGFLGKTGVSVQTDRPMIDIESDLLYPPGGYKPYCPELKMTNAGDGIPCGTGVAKGPEVSQPRLSHLRECSFGQIDSRTVLPSCTLRGTGYDRWDPLCRDPQDLASIEFPGESNVNWRMVLKDQYKSCTLQPWDQMAALPPQTADDVVCMPINGKSCVAYTGDLQPDRYSNPWPANYPKREVPVFVK